MTNLKVLPYSVETWPGLAVSVLWNLGCWYVLSFSLHFFIYGFLVPLANLSMIILEFFHTYRFFSSPAFIYAPRCGVQAFFLFFLVVEPLSFCQGSSDSRVLLAFLDCFYLPVQIGLSSLQNVLVVTN